MTLIVEEIDRFYNFENLSLTYIANRNHIFSKEHDPLTSKIHDAYQATKIVRDSLIVVLFIQLFVL